MNGKNLPLHMAWHPLPMLFLVVLLFLVNFLALHYGKFVFSIGAVCPDAPTVDICNLLIVGKYSILTDALRSSMGLLLI